MLAEIVDTRGNKVLRFYQPDGNLSEMRRDDASGNVFETTTFAYDERGNKKEMTDPSTGMWTYIDNAFGELVWQKDARQRVSTPRLPPATPHEPPLDSLDGPSL